MDIWLDATKAPSASNLSKHSMRWDLNNYQSNKWKQGKEYDVMYYGGLSAGDMDNDGNDELVVAGYRIRNTADAKKWKLDSRYLFIERLIPYGSGDDYGYKSSGNVPQMINSSDSKDQLIANSGAYGGEDKPTATDKKVLSPLTVECYKGRGRDLQMWCFWQGEYMSGRTAIRPTMSERKRLRPRAREDIRYYLHPALRESVAVTVRQRITGRFLQWPF